MNYSKTVVKELTNLTKPVVEFMRNSEFPQQLTPSVLKDAVLWYPTHPGKMLRPALLMATLGLFEGEAAAGIPVAAAVELFHTWTLVHDDIIDNDDIRRGNLATHAMIAKQLKEGDPHVASLFGRNVAILAGDIQQEWSFDCILNAPISDKLKIALLSRLNSEIGPQLISGEAEDVQFEHRHIDGIMADEILQMLTKKTALLLRYAAESGVMIALDNEDHSDIYQKKMGDFAEKIGVAFQLQDDLLGMFGNKEKLGKPVGSDFEQNKKNYLIASAMELTQGAENKFLNDCLGNKKLDTEKLKKIQKILIESGAKQRVKEKIRRLHGDALLFLEDVPRNHFRDLLINWAGFACDRAY